MHSLLFEKLRCLGVLLVVLLTSSFVVSSFLSHWSLLDGAPRNSLKMFMDGNAHRPFAYRILGPKVVSGLDNVISESAQNFLADNIAPKFHRRYVEPLMTIYESRLPGIGARAQSDWSSGEYRRYYVLMIAVMSISFAGALLILRDCARLLGASQTYADGLMLLYATITPTMFLNGGYFYDFIEQLGACVLIWYVLQARWLPALMTLVLMQLNKETALLMPIFLAPLIWRNMRWRTFYLIAVALVFCIFIYVCIRIQQEGLPGLTTEWHLPDNLYFWTQLKSWSNTEDFYSAGFMLPRISYLIFAGLALKIGLRRGFSPLLFSASLAFFVLLVLLICMGFQDEFRNLSLSLPLLLLLLVSGKSRISESANPRPCYGSNSRTQIVAGQ